MSGKLPWEDRNRSLLLKLQPSALYDGITVQQNIIVRISKSFTQQ